MSSRGIGSILPSRKYLGSNYGLVRSTGSDVFLPRLTETETSVAVSPGGASGAWPAQLGLQGYLTDRRWGTVFPSWRGASMVLAGF